MSQLVPYREPEYTAIYSQLWKIKITLLELLYLQCYIIILIVQNSRTTDDIVYADLGPNAAVRNAHQFENDLTHFNDDRVQYEEIRHEAGPSVHEPPTADKMLGNHLYYYLSVCAC